MDEGRSAKAERSEGTWVMVLGDGAYGRHGIDLKHVRHVRISFCVNDADSDLVLQALCKTLDIVSVILAVGAICRKELFECACSSEQRTN